MKIVEFDRSRASREERPKLYRDEDGVWEAVDLRKEFMNSVLKNKIFLTALISGLAGAGSSIYASSPKDMLLKGGLGFLCGSIAGGYLARASSDRFGR